jgi:hypothetical protein
MLTFILTLAVFYITRTIVRSDMQPQAVTYTLTEQDLLDMGDTIYQALLDHAEESQDFDFLNF